MTQRIFDVENEKDMADLWDILPDDVYEIEKYPDGVVDPFAGFCVPSKHIPCRTLIKINWHDKTEITRPIQEATEQDAGKLCYFWDDDGTLAYGILSEVIHEKIKSLKYGCCEGRRWTHARRLTKQEIEELC